MNTQRDHTTEPRRFLAIYFRVGTPENGYLVGPALVSTRDFAHLHFWDESLAAEFDIDGYEIIKLYPRDMTYDQAARQFTKDFSPAMLGLSPAGWWLPRLAALEGEQPRWAGRRVRSA
jgi:hypothetical protein